MSVSTQDRINRLKELERKRLEKQAELFSQSHYEPTILPKFESRITLSRSTVSDSNQQKYDTKIMEESTTRDSDVKNVTKSGDDDTTDSENEEVISEVYEMEVSDFSLNMMAKENETSKVKEEELPTTAKQAEKHDSAKQEPQEPTEKKDSSGSSTKVSKIVLETQEVPKREETSGKTKESEVEASNKDESSYKINVSNIDSLKIAKEDNSSCKIKMLKVDSEPQKAREKEKSNTEMSNTDSEPLMSSIKNDTNRNTEVSMVISDPPRTLSTSYVGPLSPTSTEKTRISVVRKMTLDSLPTVTTAKEIATESLLQTPVHKDSHTTETEKDIGSNKAKQTDATKPYLTLKEFKLKTGSNKSSLSGEHEEGKETKDMSRKGSDLFHKSAENTHEKTLSVANVEVGPTVQSPLTEEKVIKEADVGSTVDSSENATLATKTFSSGPELRSSVVEEKTHTTRPVQSRASKISTAQELTSTAKIMSDTKTVSSTSDISHPAEPSAQCSESASNELLTVNTPRNIDSDTVSKSETILKKFNKEFEVNFDAQYASIMEKEELQRAKINELQKKRAELNKAKENQENEDLSQLSVRERFFRNQSVGRIKRPVKKQSVSEQIRASRLSRRNSDYNEAPRSESPGKAAEAESPPLARRSRLQARSIDRLRRRTIDSVPVLPTGSSSNLSEEKPKFKSVIDSEALGEAFERPDRERLNRIDALERLRAQNRELTRRRDSDPALSIGASGTRLDFQPSLIVNRGSSENIAQFPIHEHLESSFPMSRFSYSNSNDPESRRSELRRSVSIDRPSVAPLSRPILRPSYSESWLFPLDGGRLSQSGILSMSTESDISQLQQSTNQQQSVVDSDNDGTLIFADGTLSGAPVIDNEGRTHLDRATSPKRDTYSSIIDHLENRNRSGSFELMFLPPHRRRAINKANNLLDPINHDHFLADCFLKKYTLKERCALIRDKIYGTDSIERGKPDGASHDSSKNKCDEPETDTSKN